MVLVLGHFRSLWSVIKRDNSKLKACPFFFWFFFPVLFFSTVINWFDLRLILGTTGWFVISYAFGYMIISMGQERFTTKRSVRRW